MTGDDRTLVVRLANIEGEGRLAAIWGDRVMEFHVSRHARRKLGIDDSLFRSTGNVIIPDFPTARKLARSINEKIDAALLPERAVRAGRLNAMALIDEILHDVARLYRERAEREAFTSALRAVESELGKDALDELLFAFVHDFPPIAVYRGEVSERAWLAAKQEGVSNRELALEELLLLRLANQNPAFGPYRFLFDDGSRADDAKGEESLPHSLAAHPAYLKSIDALERHFKKLSHFGPDDEDLVTMLRAPARESPYSLPGQLDFIRRKWGLIIGDKLLRLLGGLDLIREEEKPRFPGPGPTRAYVYRGMEKEYERFTPDRDWMPNVVMLAKSVLVWLNQLSVSYGRQITHLSDIPDEELDILATRGFNALWLIGLWERSPASAEIKRRCGNPEAASSAYSLYDYEISAELGGWPALENLRARAWRRGIRLGADMVPNHVGIDSAWVRERPELLLSTRECPFPGYSFEGGDLSGDGRIEIKIEDHYYDRTDAAVVFRRRDRATGRVDYIYHGNDGTGMAWNDTAQIDFLNPAAREAVKERILHVARAFPIIRFDAAMVLAKRHVRRLWYPEPGSGGDIPSRAGHAMSADDFERAMPEEFWREVVDLCAHEANDTLLLAEAFWMMEGYFVRTLGMHRVYNSAFMNMLKREENAKYRETIKNTQEFDKDILKRFVNFMNNPDEETAVAQFGKGDKYFGVCTMMATMPGLPMFGHGQVEGFEEKYGMEYRRAYRDEVPDRALIERHEREIFPLLKRRHLFSGVDEFLLYDLVGDDGVVNENVFAYSNGAGGERALIAYNNAYARAAGRIRDSSPYAEKLSGGGKRLSRKRLAEAFGLHAEEGRFLVMRELRSGLWFIRRSREVFESGLALMLDGYQCQVFMDIFEVHDDERGLYAAAHDALAGAGTPDLAWTIQDIVLKDLYAALAALATPDYFAQVAKLVRGEGAFRAAGERKRRLRALCAQVSAPALEFYTVLRKLIHEEAAEEGLPEGALAEDDAAAQSARDRLMAGIEGLAAIAGTGTAEQPLSIRNGKIGASGKPRIGQDAETALLLARFAAGPGAAELVAVYLIFDGVKALVGEASPGEEARRLVERLCLDRKLRESLRAAGIAGDDAYRGLSFAKALLSRSEDSVLSGDAGGRASALFRALTREEELRTLVGVNVFEGVEWFAKERFEELVALGALFGAAAPAPRSMRRPMTTARRAQAAAETARVLLEAEAESGYRLSALGEALERRVPSKVEASARRSGKEGR